MSFKQIPLMPKTAHCKLCRDFGYILTDGRTLPMDASIPQIIDATLPCGCKYGDEWRLVVDEWAKPIPYRAPAKPEKEPSAKPRRTGFKSTGDVLRDVLGTPQ